jgi:hypothetical protein
MVPPAQYSAPMQGFVKLTLSQGVQFFCVRRPTTQQDICFRDSGYPEQAANIENGPTYWVYLHPDQNSFMRKNIWACELYRGDVGLAKYKKH